MLALLGQLNRCWITLKASYYQDRNTRASVAKHLETFWRLKKTFTFTMVIFQQNIFTFTQVWLYTTLQYCSISRSWRSNSDGEETWTQTTLCGERQQIKLKLCVATNQFLDDYFMMITGRPIRNQDEPVSLTSLDPPIRGRCGICLAPCLSKITRWGP